MNSLFLLQFACFIFMLVNAAFIGLSSIHAKWKNKRYERSRWMLFFAFIGFAVQYLLQMRLGLRASGDDTGAVVNMLVYTPCFTLISKAIYNVEATHNRRRGINTVSSLLYAAILMAFAFGYWRSGNLHIGIWLYVMLFFYSISMVYFVAANIREMTKRRKMLETLTASDMLPYVRYSRASLFILGSTVLFMPAAILSTTLLYIIGPVVLLALLFFNVTFISLGSSYVPTEELLDMDTESMAETPEMDLANKSEEQTDSESSSASNGVSTEGQPTSLSAERCEQIGKLLDKWCKEQGYKDSGVNMLSLSCSLHIS
ncbi:hypothetical protein [uncultured Prevotella sp.]|uniref:hypothetical protein n=1 Tax=uncultured Prevotella sp. TaxID=159272 RepID=UPI0026023F0F|nr:hypothetical protein [uncultured Prevotella sp.]